jgi:hypothetical protein
VKAYFGASVTGVAIDDVKNKVVDKIFKRILSIILKTKTKWQFMSLGYVKGKLYRKNNSLSSSIVATLSLDM